MDIWSNRYTPLSGWGTAERIENHDGDARFPQVTVDPQGNATAVWHQGDVESRDIWSNRYTPSGGWGTAARIENRDGDAAFPQVAVDPQGNATAVWNQWNDGAGGAGGASGTPSVWDIWSSRYTRSGGWGTAARIENRDGDARGVQVAVDPQGNATAVWNQWNDGAGGAGGANGTPSVWDIWSSRYTRSGGWGTAARIENRDGDALYPQVAVDPQGNATAVWYQGDDVVSRDIWSNRYTPLGGWGTAERIEIHDDDARFPQVAVDPQGNATAVWGDWDGIRQNAWSNRYTPSGGWGTAARIEDDDRSADDPHVAVDPQGNATAVWSYPSAVGEAWANQFR
jgi:hypothetical protein